MEQPIQSPKPNKIMSKKVMGHLFVKANTHWFLGCFFLLTENDDRYVVDVLTLHVF